MSEEAPQNSQDLTVFVQSLLRFEEIIVNQNYEVLITTNEQKNNFPKLLEFLLFLLLNQLPN